jgi:hypothetical protein
MKISYLHIPNEAEPSIEKVQEAHRRTAEAILWTLAEFDAAMCASLDGETGPKVEWGSIALQRLKDRAVAVLIGNLASVKNTHFGFTRPMDFPMCEEVPT